LKAKSALLSPFLNSQFSENSLRISLNFSQLLLAYWRLRDAGNPKIVGQKAFSLPAKVAHFG